MPDGPQVSPAAQAVLNFAVKTASEHQHEFLTTEHLLYSLLQDMEAAEIIYECGADPAVLSGELEEYFAETLEAVRQMDQPPEQTAGFEQTLRVALMHAISSEKSTMDGGDLLAALYRVPDSFAVYFLEKQGVSRLDVLSYIAHGVSKRDESDPELAGAGEGKPGGKPSPQKALEAFTVNLTQMARDEKLDPIIGRTVELKRTMRTLCRRRKNNPLLVGEPGVGKTAVVEGLAQMIVRGEVPDRLQGHQIFALDMGSLLAGTRYRGDFEERLKAVLDALLADDKAIVFIDELHTVVGAGATQGGSMDASNLLKPALNSSLRCIGATTYQEYKTHILKDRAFARRFQKIDVTEPSIEDTITILSGLRGHYEKHYEVTIEDDAVETAAKLSARYMHDRFLPDKAIDVIDEAGAAFLLADLSHDQALITKGDIEATIADIANLPPANVTSDDAKVLQTLPARLKERVFGQDAAVERLSKAIKLSRAGMRDPEKPVGSFLFTGPTGVGKSEMCKQLAELLSVSFKRFDMSEYAEKHTISRLIGAPPGYVGFDQGGLLTEAIIKTPYSVVLLDEIEKAHGDIFNVLLQVMDHGTLTDNNGRKADFRNVVLVMTSNLGAREINANPIGFAERSTEGDESRAVEKFFSPEFRNRLDATIHFSSLDMPLVERVVDKFVEQLGGRMRERGVILKLSKEARSYLATKGYDPKLGARPIARIIQTEIQERLVDELLFGSLVNGGTVEVIVEAEALEFKVSPLEIEQVVKLEDAASSEED